MCFEIGVLDSPKNIKSLYIIHVRYSFPIPHALQPPAHTHTHTSKHVFICVSVKGKIILTQEVNRVGASFCFLALRIAWVL